MDKILFKIEKNCIIFSRCNGDSSDSNLNNTNVINVKNLKFTDEYIMSNLDLVSMFINLVTLKFNIDKAIIKNIQISEVVLNLLNHLDKIKYLEFTEDKELNYTICNLLISNQYLEKIFCYSLPNIILTKFEKNKIDTRLEVKSISNFLKINNIKTYSDLYNKDKIIINDELFEDDVRDLVYFLENNRNLRKVIFDEYNRKNFEATIFYINKNNLKNVTIIIKENSNTTEQILKDLSVFDAYKKKYKIRIKIHYSKEYKNKNKVKELNLTILKIMFTSILLIGLILYIATNINKNETISHIEEVTSNIEKIVNGNSSTEENNNIQEDSKIKNPYTDAYSKDYSKSYKELLLLNKDVVGWITIKNTSVNYPVVQATDNSYYLNHAFDKSYNIAGWIFADYRNDFEVLDKNTIIYGHMMSNKLMFSTLRDTLNSEWYENEENLIINFSVKEKNYKWKIFSIYVIDATNDYIETNFSNEDFIKFTNKIKSRSIKDFGVEVLESDNILTLSTCFKNSKRRIVIHSVLLP